MITGGTIVVAFEISNYHEFLTSLKKFKPSKERDVFLEYSSSGDDFTRLVALSRNKLKELMVTRSLFLMPDPKDSFCFITRKGSFNFKISKSRANNIELSSRDAGFTGRISAAPSKRSLQVSVRDDSKVKRSMGVSFELKTKKSTRVSLNSKSMHRSVTSKSEARLITIPKKQADSLGIYRDIQSPGIYQMLSKANNSRNKKIDFDGELSVPKSPTKTRTSLKKCNDKITANRQTIDSKLSIFKLSSKKKIPKKEINKPKALKTLNLDGNDLHPKFAEFLIGDKSSSSGTSSCNALLMSNCSLEADLRSSLRTSNPFSICTENNESLVIPGAFSSISKCHRPAVKSSTKPITRSRQISNSKFKLQEGSRFESLMFLDRNGSHLDLLNKDKITQDKAMKSSQFIRKHIDSSLRRILIDPIKKQGTLKHFPDEKSINLSSKHPIDPYLMSMQVKI